MTLDIYGERERRAVAYLYLVTVSEQGDTHHCLTTAGSAEAAESRVARWCIGCTVGYATLICGSDRDVQPRRVL
jgi:hypothetical protein